MRLVILLICSHGSARRDTPPGMPATNGNGSNSDRNDSEPTAVARSFLTLYPLGGYCLKSDSMQVVNVGVTADAPNQALWRRL